MPSADHERFDFDLPLLRRLGATFNAHRPKFAKLYAEKTAAEFMAACNDLTQRARERKAAASGAGGEASSGRADEGRKPSKVKKGQKHGRETLASAGNGSDGAPSHAASGGDDEEDEDADAALDDALDAMLDAQAAADGNLFDDFDEGYVDSADDSD